MLSSASTSQRRVRWTLSRQQATLQGGLRKFARLPTGLQSGLRSGAAPPIRDATGAARRVEMHMLDVASIVQGVYYMTTGVWPFISRRMFERVTGPKTDFWLVRTVGVLVAVIGAVLVMAGVRRKVIPQTAILAMGSAGGLAAVDVIYAIRGRISPIYAVEAVVEVALAVPWLVRAKQWSTSGQ